MEKDNKRVVMPNLKSYTQQNLTNPEEKVVYIVVLYLPTAETLQFGSSCFGDTHPQNHKVIFVATL